GGAGYPYALSQLNGAYQSLPDFLDTQHPIESEADAEAYLSRLDAFASAMDQEVDVARHDASLGVIPPDFALDKALTQLGIMRKTQAHRSQLVNSLVDRAKARNLPGEWDVRATSIYNEAVIPALNRQFELITEWR